MDEEDWLTSVVPRRMIEFVIGQTSDRKLRLYACACCYRISHLLNEASRWALDTAEAFADGLVEDSVRSAARKSAQQAAQVRETHIVPDFPKCERRAASSVYYAAAREAGEAAYNALQLVIEALIWQGGGYSECDAGTIRSNEEAQQSPLARDIFGNPFRPVSLEPAWLTSDVLALARGIYGDKAFDRMPILADALQDAGCNSDDILNHCRDTSLTHVRGCWVVELLLGKQ